VFDCTCNTQNSLLLNQHNGDDAPQEHVIGSYSSVIATMHGQVHIKFELFYIC